MSDNPTPGDDLVERLSIPALNPIYAEKHPLLAPIIAKRARAAGNFTPEFSGQRGADFDRGLLSAFEAVNATLQRMTAETLRTRDEADRSSTDEEVRRLRQENLALARALAALSDPAIDHTLAKRRLMKMRTDHRRALQPKDTPSHGG